MGRERIIRRDERTKHLDKLNYRGGRNEIRRIVALRQSDGEITQHTTIGEWQFLRRRSPCLQAHAVPNAKVKTRKLSL
jgi:hypothetical protein